MIISASRRTDIPAFYADWFMRRIRAGYCEVPHPFQPARISRVSLAPPDVDVIAFWTRNPRPLFVHLPELDRLAYRYYFLFTLMANPRPLDPLAPPPEVSQTIFAQLSRRIGPERVIWRYDPIVLSNLTPPEWHAEVFERLAGALRALTSRCIISLVDIYRKLQPRLRCLAGQGLHVRRARVDEIEGLLRRFAESARSHGMELATCAEAADLRRLGIRTGKCIDDDYIRRIFDLEVSARKDPAQRRDCRCVVSRDIGAYDTCPFACAYCYACSSPERARANYARHDPAAPALLPPPFTRDVSASAPADADSGRSGPAGSAPRTSARRAASA
jgi:hypothetical protein